jgi:hypothetical protein
MPDYLIELPHTDKECLLALDAISSKSPEFLTKVYWGCLYQPKIHNGWAIVNAKNEIEARNLIGSLFMREKARIFQVRKTSREEIARRYEAKKATSEKLTRNNRSKNNTIEKEISELQKEIDKLRKKLNE